jgi:hypothetical protein
LILLIHASFQSQLVTNSGRSKLEQDTAVYLGQQALQNARAARYTIIAERRLLQRQLEEGELQMRRLQDEVDAVDARLTAATHQVGLVQGELHHRGIPLDDVSNSDMDSEEETLQVLRSALSPAT